MKRISFIPAIVLLALALAGCNLSLAADVTPPPGYQPPPPLEASVTPGPLFPIVPPNPQAGAITYAEKCAPCHGPAGLGDGPQAANLPNPAAALGAPEVARPAIPAEWFAIVTNGNLERFMPPFNSLNDRQRWDVVAYALTLHQPAESVSSGAALFAENCVQCHGPQGRGDGPEATDAMPDLTDQEALAEKSNNILFQVISEGVEGKMPGFAENLSEEQRWAVTDFTRSLTFAGGGAGMGALAETAHAPLDATAIPAAEGAVTSTLNLTGTNALTTTTLSAVNGVVSNASGGTPPADLLVNLHSFDGMTLVMTATTTTAADGTFSFPEVEVPTGRSFLATIEFERVLYGSEVVQAESDGQAIQLDMQVFETTSDPAALSVDRLHYVFEIEDEQTLRVAELYIISNTGPKTVVGEGPGQPVLRFALPKGATNLEFQSGVMGERYVETAEGFADTIPVRPGSGNYQVLFSYLLPYDSRLDIIRPINWNTDAVIILAPDNGLKVSAPGLTDGGARDMQGTAYHIYNGPAMSAGSALTLNLSGRPRVDGSSLLVGGSNNNLLIGAGALGLALLVAGAWLFMRNRKPVPVVNLDDDDEAAETVAPDDDTQEGLMDAILALDDLYQDGKLAEDAYLKRRSELKARLARLMEA